MSSAPMVSGSRPVRVYVVDDEPLIHNVWRRLLRGSEFEVAAFLSARDALAALETDPDVDVVVTDLAMPEMDGLELLRAVKAAHPEIEVVVMTAHVGLDRAINAVKQGAYHFLAKPFDAEQPELIVRQAAEHKRAAVAAAPPRAAPAAPGNLVGASEPAQRLAAHIQAAARVDASVLIVGEHGSGREHVARAIHAGSARRERPFLVVSCAALEGSLLEGELFGYLGAGGPRAGAFDAARGGTLLIDEIGHAAAPAQARLQRLLESGEFRPLGAAESVRADVRVLASTSVSLEGLARQGRFREDLIHRLGVVTLEVPPLRARREDIPALARHFLAQAAARHARDVVDLDADALDALCAFSWPGNVRELANAVERAVILGQGRQIALGDLPRTVVAARPREEDSPAPVEGYSAARRRAIESFERAFIDGMLARTGGNISEAARLSGLDRANFRRIMRRVGLART